MRYTLYLVCMICGSIGSASELMIACVLQSEPKLTIQVEEEGRSVLEWVSGGKVSRCPLSLKQFENQTEAVAPQIELAWVRGHCTPELEPKAEKTLLKSLTLIIDLPSKGKPKTLFQWSRYEQPQSCVLEKFVKANILEKATRFKNGTWGK